MTDDRDTKRLRALIERPEKCEFWGDTYTRTPRLIAKAFGDGAQLMCVTPLATRPDYFVVRVDSAIVDVRDPMTGRTVPMIDEIICAAEEEYGYFGDERDENGDERRPFPVTDWGVGVCWGKPFPIADWKATPRCKRVTRSTTRRAA
jgi:hypothetical protein